MKISIEIDGVKFETQEVITIAEAAKAMGINIPRLCNTGGSHRSGCMVCAVYDKNLKAYLPSCAAKIYDGASYESENSEIKNFRKTALELILAEHRGDCTAPCKKSCPYAFDIPGFLEHLTAKNESAASEMLKNAPQCETCKGFCEKVCRRNQIDGAVKIKSLIAKYKPSDAQDLPPAPKSTRYEHNFGKPAKEDLEAFNKTTNDANACLQCHCKKDEDCRLRELAELFGVARVKPLKLRKFERVRANAVVYESAKCVLCASCVSLGGLAMRGRSHFARPDKPEGANWQEALLVSHIDVCPTGAISKDKSQEA